MFSREPNFIDALKEQKETKKKIRNLGDDFGVWQA